MVAANGNFFYSNAAANIAAPFQAQIANDAQGLVYHTDQAVSFC